VKRFFTGWVILAVTPFLAQSYDPFEPGGVSPFTNTGPDLATILIGTGFVLGIILILGGLTGSKARRTQSPPDPVAAVVHDKELEILVYQLVELTEGLKADVARIRSGEALPHIPEDELRDRFRGEWKNRIKKMREFSSPMALFRFLTDEVSRIVNASRVSVFVENQSGKLTLAVQTGMGSFQKGEIATEKNTGVMGYVLRTGETVLSDNVEMDTRFGWKNHDRYTSPSLISSPLFIDNKIAALLNLSNPVGRSTFSAEDKSEVDLLLNELSLKLENLVLRKKS